MLTVFQLGDTVGRNLLSSAAASSDDEIAMFNMYINLHVHAAGYAVHGLSWSHLTFLIWHGRYELRRPFKLCWVNALATSRPPHSWSEDCTRLSIGCASWNRQILTNASDCHCRRRS